MFNLWQSFAQLDQLKTYFNSARVNSHWYHSWWKKARWMFNLCEIVQQGKLNWKSPTRKIKLKLSNRKNELIYLVYKRNWTDFVQQEKWTDIVDKNVLSQFKSHNSKWDSFAIKAKFEIQFMMKKSQINAQFVTDALHNWTNWKTC